MQIKIDAEERRTIKRCLAALIVSSCFVICLMMGGAISEVTAKGEYGSALCFGFSCIILVAAAGNTVIQLWKK